MAFTLCVPCLLGLEGPIAGELRHMKMDGVAAENGRVYFSGGPEAVARANVNLRVGERVLIELGRFDAPTFDALFEGVRALPWEQLIPRNGAFPVKGYSLNSKLFSVSDCQKIIKKAIVERLKQVYGLEWFPEDGPLYQVQFAIMKDSASLCIDTSGDGLHKRGYRPAHNAAPLKETMAAALVAIAHYRGREDFCDPFCGSGTIPIEAALIAKNRAPGIARSFSAMRWPGFDAKLWDEVRAEARAREFRGDYRIFASDIDPEAVRIARENARRAGVDDVVRFEVADAARVDRKTANGILITNPPYGERILEKQQAEALYAAFGRAWRAAENWKLYLLSAHTEFERAFGRAADQKRKLYNGMLKCDLFMYR
jgi:putative N6-adenine-specific DNA methylase